MHQVIADKIPIPERFHCLAEQRALRFRINLAYEDIGEESWVFPKQVSALPTFEGVDEAMISLLIAEYGKQGIKSNSTSDPHA